MKILTIFAQVIWKKEQAGYLTKIEADEIITAFLELPFEIFGHCDILPDALSIARQNLFSVYDALFLALAKYINAELVTADKRL